MGREILITDSILAAHLKCKLKSQLIARSTIQETHALFQHRKKLEECHTQAGLDRLRKTVPTYELHEGTPPRNDLLENRYRFIINPLIIGPGFQSRVHALSNDLKRLGSQEKTLYPIRFIASAKLTEADKIALAFDAIVLSKFLHCEVGSGWAIYGPNFKTAKIDLSKLKARTKVIISEIANHLTTSEEPDFYLNKHCPECQFQSRCRKLLIERDDLSLLRTVTIREREKYRARGVLTVNQLSYTFKPRRSSQDCKTHEPSLKALAIRKNLVHVAGEPKLNIPSNAIYLDVEGVPELNFYYLIGWRYDCNGTATNKYAWADTTDEEQKIWWLFFNDLRRLGNVILIHYGRYEITFLSRMKKRYCQTAADIMAVDSLMKNAINILSFLWSQIYIPTYSNGLKEVAAYLGYQRKSADASGLHALMWRSEWDADRTAEAKHKLIAYNIEDCEATECVAKFVANIATCDEQGEKAYPCVSASSASKDFPHQFGPLEHAIADFKLINQAAYWKYQRSKVYVRTNRHLKTALKDRRASTENHLKATKIIQASRGRDKICVKCGGSSIHKHAHQSTLVVDLKFSPVGVRRQVIEYQYMRYRCWDCYYCYNEIPRQPRHGPGLHAFVTYSLFQLMISQHAVAENLTNLFGIRMSAGAVNIIKRNQADYYTATYNSILSRLQQNHVIYADETQIKIGKTTRYVWVLASTEDVYYFYSESRESSTIQKMIGDFRGVLVSDFYAAYDTIKCAKQKCLIHLMRDINDDLLKNPFDNELCAFARSFGDLLRPIVETIDRYGLKRRHFSKHKDSASAFIRSTTQKNFTSDAMLSYKKRLLRNADALFTFLDYDDVTWNNNNAEHAVKAVARLRNVVSQNWTERGVKEYLVLLSISETCHYRNINFLDFLRYRSTDLLSFSGRKRRIGVTATE
jgi:predicted RecB family nuclease